MPRVPGSSYGLQNKSISESEMMVPWKSVLWKHVYCSLASPMGEKVKEVFFGFLYSYTMLPPISFNLRFINIFMKPLASSPKLQKVRVISEEKGLEALWNSKDIRQLAHLCTLIKAFSLHVWDNTVRKQGRPWSSWSGSFLSTCASRVPFLMTMVFIVVSHSSRYKTLFFNQKVLLFFLFLNP